MVYNKGFMGGFSDEFLEDREIIMENRTAFGTEKISRLLLRLAPPVMLAQLIQALYNIMDSFL